jgi:hypothetical protein
MTTCYSYRMVLDPISGTATTAPQYNTRYLIRKSYGCVNQCCAAIDGGKARYVRASHRKNALR